MPRKNNKRIIKDSDDELTENEYSETPNNRYYSSSSESKTSDNENSENESEYTDTEDNIEKVINNDISDNEFNKDDNDINLLSDSLNNLTMNYKISDKPIKECYNILQKFLKDNCIVFTKENKDENDFKKNNDNITFSRPGQKEKYFRIQRVLGYPIFIKINDYNKFLELVNDIAVKIKDDEFEKYMLCYLENYADVIPLLIDIDYHYDKKNDDRLYEEIIDIIINQCDLIIIDLYNPQYKFYHYVFTKNKITKDKEDYKDGFHLGYYNIPIKKSDYPIIRNELIKRLGKIKEIKEWYERYGIKKDLNDFVDSHLITAPYMMYHNTKYLAENNYKPSPVYHLLKSKCNDPNIDNFEKYAIILSSVNQFYLTNTPSLKIINNDLLKSSSSDSEDKPKSKKQKIDNDDIDIDTINNSSDTSDSEDIEKKINKENKYLTLDKVKTINSRFIIDDIREFIDILDIKYSENEDDWYQIYYAIYSFKEVHPELLDEIKNEMDYFSLKSRKKYAKSDNESILKHYKKGKISLNNLIKYAYKSNKDKTNKLYGEIKRRNKILQEKEELEDYKKYDTTIKKEEKEIINIPKDETFNYDYFYYLFKKDILECLNYWYKFNYFTSIKNTKGENIDIILRLKRITKEKEIFNTEKNEYVKKKYNYYEFEKILDINKIIPKTHYKYLLDEEIGNIKKIKNIDYKDIEQIIQKDNKILVKDLILHTLPFNKYYSFNDINAPLLYQIKYYNQYDIHFRTERFINFNHIAIEFYFNDILSCDKPNISFNDYGVKEICDFIKNYVCCKNDDEIYEEVEDDIKKVIDDKYNYIMNFFKCIFNRKKNNTILCLSGTQGTGKSTVNYIINKILKYNISHSEQGSGVFSQFNKYQSGLFFGIEEFEISDKTGNENNFAKLKDMITNPRVEINKKGIESENVKNVCNYIITSNNINLFKLENSDRRTTIFNMFKTPKEGKQYFIDLYKIIKNKECLINFYNYVKYSKFGEFDNIDVFKVQDAIITEEKNNLTVNTADTYNKFLINFYNLLNYIDKFPDDFNINEIYKDVYVDDNNKIIYKDKDNDNFNELIKNKNSIKYICLTIPRFYKCYKNYCSKVLQLNENQGFNNENFKSNINKDKLFGYPLDKENKKSKNKYVFITKDYLFSLLNKKKLGNEFIDFDDENYAKEFNAFDFIKY